MKKGIMTILSILFLAGNVFGQTGFQAVENGGKVTITGYTGTAKEVVIPGTVNGMPIVAIGNEAFRGKGLTSITIPASVTTIGIAAFADNDQLISITIGANVTIVAENDSWGNVTYTFGYGFDNVYNNSGKPAGVFKRGSRLDNGYIWGMVSGDFLYMGTTITGYTGSGGVLTIPSTINGTPVTAIEGFAFREKRLTSVTIPNSVISIGEQAFYNNQLTSVTIPNSVITIGNSAFCANQLTSATIGNNVTTIGSRAFQDNRLINVTIGNSVTTIKDNAFWRNQLSNVIIPDSVIVIEAWAFQDNKMTSVTIGNGVKTIAGGAFYENQLTSITIGANVTLTTTDYSYLAFGSNGFEETYNNGGRSAGTYTRASTSSTTWTKGTFSF